MGIWNATCGISHLPIQGDEPCRLLFLVESIRQERGDGGFTGTEDLWTPFSLPIPGLYDENGCLKDAGPDWYIQVFIDQVRSLMVEMEAQNEFDEPVSKDDLDLDTIIRHVYNGKMALDAGEQGLLHLGLVFIREDIYEALGAGPFIDGNQYIEAEIVQKNEKETIAHEMTVTKLIAQATMLKEMAETQPSPPPEEDENEDGDAPVSLLDTASETLMNLQNYKRLISGVNDGTPAFEPVRTELARKVLEGVDIEDDSVRWGVHEIAKLRLVRWHMKALRRAWMPQPGNGSQSTGWLSNQVLLDAMRAVVEPALEKEHS